MAVDLHDSKLIRKIGNVDSINRINAKYQETETMIKFKRMKNRKTATSVKDICSTSYIDDKVENRTPLTDDTCEQTTTDPVNTDFDIACEHTNTDPADTGEHTTTHHDDIFSSLLHF
jgi:hypothetical protein